MKKNIVVEEKGEFSDLFYKGRSVTSGKRWYDNWKVEKSFENDLEKITLYLPHCLTQIVSAYSRAHNYKIIYILIMIIDSLLSEITGKDKNKFLKKKVLGTASDSN